VGDLQVSDVRVLLNSATSTASLLDATVPGCGMHQLEAIYPNSGPCLGSTPNAVAATGTPIPTTVLVCAPIANVGAVSLQLTNGQAIFNLEFVAGTYSLSTQYSGSPKLPCQARTQ
jgi:hypothetical protein